MLSSTTPRKLRLSYQNVGRNIAFCSDNGICLPIFGISRLNHFNFSAFSLLPCLPTLKLISYPISSKANYGWLVYLTRRDSHPLYDTTWLGRTDRHRILSGTVSFCFLLPYLNVYFFTKALCNLYQKVKGWIVRTTFKS